MRAADNEVDVDAIVKDIQAKVWEGVIGGPRRGRPTARARERGWLGRMGRRRPSQAPAPMRTTDWAGARGARGLRSRGATPGARGPAPRAVRLTDTQTLPLSSPVGGRRRQTVRRPVRRRRCRPPLAGLDRRRRGQRDPLVPKLLELVGLGYTAWFVYRYLLFKSSREELLADIEELKKKITS